MFKLKLLAIIAIAVLSCWLAPLVSDYAWRKANRLEQMGTGADPDRLVVQPPVDKPVVQQERDDFQRPRVRPQANTQQERDDFDPPPVKPIESTLQPGQPPKLMQVDPERREMPRQAVMYRNVSVACRKLWWQAPVATIVLGLMMLAMSRMKRARMESFMARMAAQRAAEEAQQITEEVPNAE